MRFKRFFSLLALLTIFMVTSCGDTTIDINGSMDISIYKTSISIETTFEDSESGLIANNSVKCYIVLFDNEETEVSRKNVTIDIEALTGSKIEFSNLEADTDYVCKLVASKDGKQKTLETKSIKTINNGETEDDPILITNLNELKAMNKDSEAYYKLSNDIDCEETDLSAIFNSSNPFSGHFDGQNYTIKNVKLDTSSTYTGIFGYVKNAEIKDLKITNVSFNATRGERYIGALAGKVENTTITNIVVDGFVIEYTGQTSKTAMIGGLLGWAKGSTIENCIVDNISFTMPKARFIVYTGGFIGQNENSLISNCSVKGTMDITVGYTANTNGLAAIGGFVGLNESSKGINDSYAKVDISVSEVDTFIGNLTHTTYVGGFVGTNYNSATRLFNCAVIGDIDVNVARSYNVYVGGIAGRIKYNSNLQNCVYSPSENGITLVLMNAEEGTVKDDKVVQKVYASLTCGYVDAKVVMANVIAYSDLLSCTPAPSNDNQIVINGCTVSQDLSSFSTVIADLFKEVA